ncbi:MAG: glycoside hydrolase family 2 protein, partial [Clostridia bacterium]|nr:glycoside hydrolase family 2 protein [Clostridia bacterium]
MRELYPLNTGWMFEKVNAILEKEKSCYMMSSHEVVNLPHTWNAGDNNDRGKYVYQRDFSLGSKHADQEIYIEFLGANSVCQVYVNNTYLGEHRGGYATFRFCITQLVRWHENNELTVFVDNSPTEDVSPLAGDFTIYGGLYRGVNLICTDKNHFDLDYYGTSGVILRSEVDEEENGILHLELHTKCTEGVRVQVSVLDENHETIETKIADAS